MNQIISQMLSKYTTTSFKDKENAIKEIVQEITLSGLYKGKFFNKAVFCGGTALRIFHGLDRFSEDLDFSLIKRDTDFNIESFFSHIKNEANALGLNFEVTKKDKHLKSNIESAILKGNTKELIISFYSMDDSAIKINRDQLVKIKFEVDINPAQGGKYETKFGLLPYPYQVKLYDMPTLFAGKIHAILCRGWNTRVKGRDLYDYLFFISLNTKVNLEYLKQKLIQSNYIQSDVDFTLDYLKQILFDKFERIKYQEAKEDVLPFIKDSSKLDIWSSKFFISITKNIQK